MAITGSQIWLQFTKNPVRRPSCTLSCHFIFKFKINERTWAGMGRGEGFVSGTRGLHGAADLSSD